MSTTPVKTTKIVGNHGRVAAWSLSARYPVDGIWVIYQHGSPISAVQTQAQAYQAVTR